MSEVKIYQMARKTPSLLGRGGCQQSKSGEVELRVNLSDETVWVTQAQLSDLFNKSKGSISDHISNIFEENELVKNSVVRDFRTTASDGKSYVWIDTISS